MTVLYRSDVQHIVLHCLGGSVQRSIPETDDALFFENFLDIEEPHTVNRVALHLHHLLFSAHQYDVCSSFSLLVLFHQKKFLVSFNSS